MRQNNTEQDFFHLQVFLSSKKGNVLLSVGLLLMYLQALFGNILIIVLVCLAPQLHTPMYFFLGNLAFQDIIFSSAILPKVTDIGFVGHNIISFTECLVQLFIFALCVPTDFFILSIMAYDRYVAICIPLHYYHVMNPKVCTLLMTTAWILYISNALYVTLLIYEFSFCKSHELNYLFCDFKIMMDLSCSDITHLQRIIAIESVFFGFLPLLLILTSYIYIVSAVLKIRTSTARIKTFSSCSSHLTVVSLFSGTSMSLYLKPQSENSGELNKLIPLLYVGLVPMLNPLVYSLRNRQVWSAVKMLYAKFLKHLLSRFPLRNI